MAPVEMAFCASAGKTPRARRAATEARALLIIVLRAFE
jgi:hypothetical protein